MNRMFGNGLSSSEFEFFMEQEVMINITRDKKERGRLSLKCFI
jgi:hypothetical protein